MTWKVGPGHEVTSGTVAAALQRRPVGHCDQGHRREVAALAGELAERVARALGVAERPRMRRQDRCVDCGATLTMPVRRTQRTVTVEDLPLPLVTVILDVPSTRCPDCGREQVPSRSGPDVTAAAAALLEDAGPA